MIGVVVLMLTGCFGGLCVISWQVGILVTEVRALRQGGRT